MSIMCTEVVSHMIFNKKSINKYYVQYRQTNVQYVKGNLKCIIQ